MKKSLLQKNWVQVLILLLGLALVVFFGLRAGRAFFHLRGSELHPERPDPQDIRGWMTPAYISKAFRLPPEYLYEKLEISPNENAKRSLQAINRLYYPDQPGYILARTREVVAEYLQSRPPRPPQPPEAPSPP